MTLDMDTMKEIHVRESGAWTEVGEVHIMIGGAWVPVWSSATPLAATLSSSAPYGAGSSSGSVSVTTNIITAEVTGGTPPYTYAWNRDDSGLPAWTIGSATSASTDFTCTAVSAGARETAEFECVVTDSLGATATSDLAAAIADNYGGPF